MLAHQLFRLCAANCVRLGAALLLAAFAGHVAAAEEHDPRDSAPPDKVPEVMRKIIAFE